MAWRALRRWAHRGLGLLGASLLFASSFVASVVLHGDLPSTRRFVARSASRLLDDLLEGSVQIHRIDRLGFDGLDIHSVEARDPWGQRVLLASKIRVQFSLPQTVQRLLTGAGAIHVTIDEVHVEHAYVDLDLGPDGRHRIHAAFAPAPSPSPPSSSPTRLHIKLPRILIDRAQARGTPVDGLPMHAGGRRLLGRLDLTEQAFALDIDPFSTRTQLLPPLNPQGTVEYHLHVAPGSGVQMRAAFNGKLAQMPASASMHLAGARLTARLDAPHIEPEDLHSLLPQLPLQESAAFHADINGTLPELGGEIRLLVGTSAEAKVKIDTRMVDGIEADARWSVRHLDPRLFQPSAPATSLGGEGRVWLRYKGGELKADAQATTFPFLVGEQIVPSVSVEATVEGGELKGQARVHEPGVENSWTLQANRERGVSLEGVLTVGELREVTRLGRVAEGKVAATVTARLDPSGELDATVRGAYQNLHQGLLRSAAGSLQARVSGPLDRLTTESSLISEGLDLGGFRVRRAMAGAAGPLLSPSVRVVLLDERWKSLSLAADLRLQPAPRVEDLRLRFQGDERVQVDARVKQISASAAGIELRGIEVQGPSAQAQGAVLLREDGFKLDLAEGQVDLAGFARYLAPGVGAPALGRLTSGTLTFGGKLDAKGAQRSGTFSARVRDLCSREHPVVLHGEAHLGLWDQQVSSTFRTEALQGECGAAIPQGPSPASPLLASARGQAVGTIQGSLLSPGNWERASGSVELFDLKVDLDQLSRHPLVEELRAQRSKGPAPQRIPRIQGTLAATTRITRTSPERFPEIQATFVSEQLAVELPPQGDAPRRLEGLNVSGLLALAPSASAPRELRAALRLAAHAGPNQAQITAATSFEPDALRRALAGLSGPDPLAGLRSLPVESDFLLPQQPIETLPPALRPLPLAGLASARGRLQGSLDRPELSAEVDIRNLHTSIELLNRWSLDVSLAGTMGEGGVVVSGGAQHRSVGGARQDGKASFWVMSTRRPGDLLWGRGTRWQADAELSLDRWHLETIPMLAERGVQGQVSGTLQALRMHVQPHLRAQLALENMKIADTEVAPTRVRASIQESESEVVVSSQQPPSGGEAGGELELAALPQVRFEDQLVPSLDASKAHRLDLRLRNFDIEPFSPLVAPLLADLRGRLDGSFSLSFGAKEEQNRISGGLRWSRGVLLIPQLGQTFTEGHFNLSTTEDRGARETRIDLRDLRLSASTGGIEGEASFHVPNDALARYLLPAEGGATPPTIRGEFSAVIPPSEKIPVTFEGLALGDAHGKTSGVIQFRPGELRVDVAIPELTFDLPETTSQQNLQSLGENPLIGVIEASRQARKREEAPTTPMTVLLNVGLGATLDDLQQDREPSGSILVRRASVDVKLAGITRSTLVGELAMFGTVETFSGRIVVLGKPFDVRRGFVRFEGQPTNPYLNVGATWDAPDGTRVFADLLGYLKDAKLRLRSEPARPESDVLSLVLFGRDPSASTTTPGGPSSTSGSLAVGSGVASTLLNSFIDPVQVFGRRIETRVESTSHRGTSIGVAAELRPRLWAQVDVSTASQRERQNTDLSAVTLDWRFRPAWSLRSTVGDRGSSLLELLWQFKY